MPKKTAKKPQRVRRTNAERSATTRSKLIAAAIDTLYKSGHSATTTIEVAKRARVSRGAMLHQFPTRVDMLLAVAKHIIDADRAFRRERLGSNPGTDRFFHSTEVSWAVHSKPSGIAMLEILMATRSDADLRRGMEPFRALWIEGRNNAAARMAMDLGVDNVAELDTYIMVQQACLRGLAIELMFARTPERTDKARELLGYFDRMFAEKLLAKKQTSTKKVLNG